MRPAADEAEAGSEAEEAEQPASAATSSGEESASTSSDPLADYFVRHKLTKRDTLAGLAVRYNVTISDIKRANGFLADTAMFGKDTLLIPTRPLPVGPEYSTWAGMIVMHYGRLGPSDESAPSDSPCAQRFSQTRAMRQLRGYYSTGPSRSQSPQYASGAEAEDSDRHHLFAGGRGAGSGGGGDWAHLPGQVELMERSSSGAAASYIEERLRRRGRGDSQQENDSSGHAAGGEGSSAASGGGLGALLHGRPPLFGSGGEGAALASAGARQVRQWKETLLQKLKKVASQPALAVPASTAAASMQQLAQAAVTSSPLLAGAASDRPGMRQRASSSGGGPKAD